MRLTLGIVTSLDFKRRLKSVLERLKPYDISSDVHIDSELLWVLALLNELARQKLYCRKEHSWTHLFDTACFAWQPRHSTS
ncbi:MAG: hypothetical protein ACE5IF_02970 [Candidatus Bathyarchaeia archaeon]